MKFKNSILSIFLCVTTVLLGFVVYSCKVGLGETVDTEPPKVYIENPKIKAVESNDIQVNGTWEDDKGISRIKIYVYNSDTNTQVIPSPEAGDSPVYAAIDGKNWSYTLFTTASDLSARSAEVADLPVLSDGTYRLAVVAYDNIGHESATMERIFEVDNNPPVFVLSKPASLENNANPSAYGRKIEIKGVISDDHFNDFMQVRIFREDGTEIELAKSTFNKFDNSDTYVTVAQYYSDSELAKFGTDSEERKLHENYIRIYGQKGDEVFGTTQKYYAVITVKDSGENESKLAYLKTNLNKIISEAVNSLAAKDESSVEIIEDLKPFEFKDILKDSYSGNLSNAQRELVKNILNGNYNVSAAFSNGEISKEYEYLAKDEQGHKLSFTVNSKANPTYQVLGFNLPEEPGKNSFGKTAKTGTLNLRVSSGLDGSEIYPNGITARIIKLDSNLNDPRNSDGRVIDENGNDVTDDYVIFIDGTKIYDINGNSIAENETAFSEPATFSINLTDFKDRLTAGRYYLVEVDGEDIKENEFLPSNDSKFGFFVELSSGAAKSVFEKNKEYVNAREFAQDDTFVLKISDDDTESNINVIAKTLIFKDKIMDTLSIDDFDAPAEELGYDGQFTDTITGLTGAKSYVETLKTNFKDYFDSIFNEETGKYDGDNFTIAIRVTLAKQEAATSNEIYYIFADNKAPGITLSNAELKKENWDKNGNIIVTDNQLKKTGELYYYTVNGLWNDLNGSGTSKVWYYFVDDISPDFVLPVNTKTDDDESEDAANGWRRVSSVGAPETTKEMKLSEEFPLVSGEGKNKGIFFYATDKVGNKTELMQFKNIIFDYNAPTLTSSVVPEYYKQGDNAQITFKADDTNEICDIELSVFKYAAKQSSENGVTLTAYEPVLIAPADYEKNGIKVSDFVIAENAKSGTRTVTLSTDGTCDGKYRITSVAKDIAGRTVTGENVETTVDVVKPVLNGKLKIGDKEYSADSGTEFGGYFNSSTLRIEGDFTEKTSGMSSYWYYVKTPLCEDESVPDLDKKDSLGNGWIRADFKKDTTSFNFALDSLLDNVDKAGNVLYIKAADNAGNMSDELHFAINIDKTAPKITSVPSENEVLSFYNKKTTSEFVLIAHDDIRIDANGWKDFSFVRKNPDKTELVLDSETTYNGMFYAENGIEIGSDVDLERKNLNSSINIKTDGTGDGEYTIKVRAKDDAGNSSDEVKFVFTVDGTAPVFRNDLTIQNNKDWEEGKYYSSTTLKVTGTYEEKGTGIDTFYYYIAKPSIGESGAVIPAEVLTDEELQTLDLSQKTGYQELTVKAGTLVLNFNDENFINNIEGQKSILYVQAKDQAGNLSQINKFDINIDTKAPEFTSTGLNEYYSKGKEAKVEFVAKDANQITGIDFIIKKDGVAEPLTLTPDAENANKFINAENGITLIKTPASRVPAAQDSQETVSTMQATITFNADGNHDGIFTIEASATDIAGKKTILNKLVTTIDGSEPEYKENSLAVGGRPWSNNSSYYKNTTLKISGTFEETPSGMDTVYYYVQYPGRTGDLPKNASGEPDFITVAENGEITAISDGSYNFKAGVNDFTISIEDFKQNSGGDGNKLYIQGVDKAGNKSKVHSFDINIDPSEAELSVVLYKVEGTNLKSPSGTVYASSKSTNAFTVYGNYSDEQSGVARLAFKLGDKILTPDSIKYSAEAITENDVNKLEEKVNDITYWKDYSEFEKSQDIKSWCVVFKPDSEHKGTLKIEGKNGTYIEGQNGGTTSLSSFRIELDEKDPEINNVRLIKVAGGASSDAYSVTDTDDKVKYFINNIKDTNLTISGVSTDDTGVDNVTIEITGKNSGGETKTITKENKGTATVWRFEGINLSELSSKAEAKVTVTDIAGNSTEHTLEILFDTTEPVSIHQLDAKSKDLYFRVGDTDNDDIQPETSSAYTPFYYQTKGPEGTPVYKEVEWNDDKDKDVGGKYSEGTYGNTFTIKIRGNFGDGNGANDSGVKMIYYKVFDHDPGDDDIKKVIAHKKDDITGYFAPLAAAETKRVFYNVVPQGTDESDAAFAERTFGGTCLMKLEGDKYVPVMAGDNYKYFKDVAITYNSTLSGFKEGNNFVVIVAEDNVGNVGVSSVNINGTDYKKLTLNVDIKAPEIQEINAGDFAKIFIVNNDGKGEGEEPLIIEGKVKDDKAGIKSFKIKVNETYIPAENITYETTDDSGNPKNESTLGMDDKEHTWHAVIPADIINAQSGAIAVYAEAVDNAGTGQSVSRKVASIQVDNIPPSARVTSTAGWIKDSIKNASVYVNDANGIKKNTSGDQEISYNVYASTDKEYATSLASGTAIVGSDGTATVKTISTNDGTKFTDGKSYIVRFTASDIVGNTSSENSGKYTVDRTSPTLNDSDSGIDTVKAKIEVEGKWFMTETLSVSGKFTDGAGSLEKGSGVQTIHYALYNKALKDITNADTAVKTGDLSANDKGEYSGNIGGFISGTNTLKIWAVDKVENTSSSTDYTVKVDTTPPSIDSNHKDDSAIINANGRSSITVKGTVKDNESGIKEVKIKVDGNTNLITAEPVKGTDANGQNDWTGGWQATIDIDHLKTDGELKDGTLPVQATAFDNAGNSTPISVATINIDRTPPTIKISTLSDADKNREGTYVNGIIELSGTASDTNAVSSIEGLYYKVVSDDTVPAFPDDYTTEEALTSESAGWKKIACTITGTTSWTASGINTRKLDGSTIVDDNSKVYIIVAAKDSAGNIGYKLAENKPMFNVIVDQNTDRPIITLSQLTKTTVKTLKTKNVYGSITDDDGDGAVNKFWYTNKAPDEENPNTAPVAAPSYTITTKEDGTKTITWAAAGWKEIEVNGGSWSVDSTENDGETTWYFAVADANNTVFWSKGSTQTDNTLELRPYLIYKAETPNVKDGSNSGATFKYDTNPPTATDLKLYRAPTGTTYTAEQIKTFDTDDDDSNNLDWKGESGIAFGGNYNVLYAKVTVEESTGMKALTPPRSETEPLSTPITMSYKGLKFEQICQVQGTGESKNKYTYYIGPIIMDTTEAHNLQFTVEDAVENKGFISRSIIVDNTAPSEIKNVKPVSTEAVSGVINFRGNMNDNEDGSGIYVKMNDKQEVQDAGIRYYIPTYSQKDADPSTIVDTEDEIKWKTPTTLGSVSWEIEFKHLGTDIGYNSSTYQVSDDFKDYETINGSGLYQIPVWFKLTDKVGNVGYNKNNSIRFNPNADRPTVEITYPTHDKKFANGTAYVSLGGTITISGAAADDDGISAVYLQFDMDGDGTYENGVDVTGCPYIASGENSVLVDIPVKGNNETVTGVKAIGTKSWYYSLNVSGLQNLNSETEAKTLNVRAISIEKDNDKDNKDFLYSAWSDELHISVNNEIPNFSNVRLLRFDTAPTAQTLKTASANGELAYTGDMYINGTENWYVTGEVAVSAVSTITMGKVWAEGSSDVSYEVNGSSNTMIAYTDVSNKTCYFAIPIKLANNTTTGNWNVKIYAQDSATSNPGKNFYPLSINLDATAPSFFETNSDGTVKLFKDGYGNKNGTELNLNSSDNYIQNKNGAFTLAGKLTEDGSQFDKAVFYFKRTGSETRVYNIMESCKDTENPNRTALQDTKEDRKVSINTDNLPALWLSSVERTNNLTIKADSLKNNKNIRVGGLVKIGGVYRHIDNIEKRDSDGEITFTPGCDQNYTEAEFIYAMVVDNNGESSNADGTVKNDDGDGMIESYSKSGNDYTWDATINSKNIPDGPIEIHCVLFDKAGNCSHGYTSTKISNNPPRITSVMLGTDLNADEKYALDTEFTSFYFAQSRNSNGELENDTQVGTAVWNLDTKKDLKSESYWTAKKGLVVIPEFVGGTGDIYYRYDKAVNSTTGKDSAEQGTKDVIDGNPATLKKLDSSNDKVVSADGEKATFSASQEDNSIGLLILTNAEDDSLTTIGYGSTENDKGEDKVNTYSFSFWDSTEELTVGSETQWSVLNVILKQDLVDGEAPKGTITPFYWYSSSNNSLYQNSTANGHIELESDWESASGYDSTKEEYDGDPKVSGKIKVEGNVSDETMLKTITVAFANKSVTATFNKSERSWTCSPDNDDDYKLTITDTANGPTQNGHSVTWMLEVDTGKVVTNSAVGLEKTITVSVTDASTANEGNGNANTVGTESTTTAEPTAYYKVDIVPYISSVTTQLAGTLKSSIRSAYGRTSLGHYIAQMGEKITINGFNLTGGTVTFEKENGTCSVDYDASGIVIPADAKSGIMSIVVNNVETLNNKNNNNACGAYKTAETDISETSPYSDKAAYAYNRMPNRTSNNLLTDDVMIDIWQFDSDAAVPRSGELREPSMRINPVNGKVGVAFVSGPGDFAMAGGSSVNTNADAAANADPSKDIYSYNLWQNNYATFNNVSFTYDSLGYAHATATGLDTNPNDLHSGRFSYFYNKWGRSGGSYTGNYDGLNAVRLESLAVPTNKVPVANAKIFPTWMKVSYDFEPSYLGFLEGKVPIGTIRRLLLKGVIPEVDSLTETRFYSPSMAATVHGTGDTASTAVYLAYYDSLQGQIRFRYSSSVPKTWVRGETRTKPDNKTEVISTTFEKWSVAIDNTVTVDENYKEEYLTGAQISVDENGKYNGSGTFQADTHHALNDKDDFVDNLGYFKKVTDREAYMEANTDHFSLIAGVDYQAGEDIIATTDENVSVYKTDADGNTVYTVTQYRRAVTQDDTIVLDQNKKDPYDIKTKKLNANEIKKIHADLQSKFNTTDTITYIVKGDYWWILQDDGLVYMGPKNPDSYTGKYTHKLKTVTSMDIDGKALDGEFKVYESITNIEEDDPSYYVVDPGSPEFFVPYHKDKGEVMVNVPIIKKEITKSTYDTGYTGYKYVAIDAKTGTNAEDDVVVTVWFDGTNCRYAYNDNPTSGLDNGSAGGWKGNKVIFSEGGEHCTVKLDSDGGVHIAAYVDGSLRYAHLDSPAAEYNEATDSVKVDSFTITGERITLDVGKDSSGNVIPYISYFNGTARLPCVAKLVVPESGTMKYNVQGTGTLDGEDMFTGNWEISLVPSSKKLTTNYYDKMNICLWKKNGAIVRGDDADFTISKDKTSANNSSGATNGNIYGNGTANPILGYAIESNSGICLETAQMK